MFKGARPFGEWVLDTMTNLAPPGPAGEDTIVLAVDAFSKYVVGAALVDRCAATVARWFNSAVVCVFGIPAAIRVDRGTEFLGEFRQYCRSLGIEYKTINVAWPRA